MKWVHIYRRDIGNGTVKIAATAKLNDSAVEFEGEGALIEQLNRGFLKPATGKTLTPSDGEEFLKHLKNQYRSLDLLATDMQEGDRVAYPQSVE
jgi:hypothetical protein